MLKVILKKDVKDLGDKGSIIQVADGYARNFLLRKKLAVLATSKEIKKINMEKEKEAQKQKKEQEQLTNIAKDLTNTTLVIQKEASSSGKLFGSITAHEICEKIMETRKYLINPLMIKLAKPIQFLGEYNIDIEFSTNVKSQIKLKVLLK